VSLPPWVEPPTPELPPAIGPGPSPFWPQHLVDLFFRPTRFFRENLALGKTPYVIVVTWALGISAAIDRIDTRLMQAELTGDARARETIELLFRDWRTFWLVVAVSGAFSGALYWWLGGWWCKVRLRFSGAPDPDPRLARLLLIYASFVSAGPAILGLVALTWLYPSYLVAYEEEVFFSLMVLVMLFWSLGTVYRGALALFPVQRGRAIVWFLVLPVLFYVLVMGGAAALYAFADRA